MGAGKSRIGRALAHRLERPFVDTDKVIEVDFGLSVADIFTRHGEPAFREAERTAIARLIAGPAQVMAIGGGAFVDRVNRDLLNAATTTVWIDPPFEVLLARIRRSDRRPLAAGRSDEELYRLWQERQDSYAQAHLRIRTSDEPAERFADAILAQLR